MRTRLTTFAANMQKHGHRSVKKIEQRTELRGHVQKRDEFEKRDGPCVVLAITSQNAELKK
jgi:hypothetical protein